MNTRCVHLAKSLTKASHALWESIVCPKGDFDEWYKKKFVWRLFNLWCKKVIWLLKGANGIDER